MAKRPKEKWQADVRAKLDVMGMSYQELADRLGVAEGSLRQVMCKNNSATLKKKICEYLRIEE